MSALAGIFGPIVVAQFTGVWPGTAGWRATFYLTMGTAPLSTLIYLAGY
jgi:hypothetical protein